MSLRELMPVTAGWVDELRSQLGKEFVDALVRRSMQGQGSRADGNLHAIEAGPDGVQREFGRAIVDRPVVTLRGMDGVQVSPHCSIDRNGSSRPPPHAGNSSLVQTLLRDSSKGVV